MDRASCIELDISDPLKYCRDRFELPKDIIYLDGNSLSARPKHVQQVLQDTVVKEWGEGLIRSWNSVGWFDLPSHLGDRLGNLLGAEKGQTLVCDGTSVNLYKAIYAALEINSQKNKILTQANTFPTDLYIMEGIKTGFKTDLCIEYADVGDSIIDLMDRETAVVVLSHVDYKTGEILPMDVITQAAHEVGAVVVWDVCHTAGVVPIELDKDQVDFAVGCTYKYLNGGPGSPAFIYVAKKHIGRCNQPLSGWWGHLSPFEFSISYTPDNGIKRFLCGTQPILSMKGAACGLDTYKDISIRDIREKSKALTALFIELVEEHCSYGSIDLISPREAEMRGSQVSFAFEYGYEVIQAMIDKGVIGDFRTPNIMRFGFSPLYTRYVDVWDAVSVLKECMEKRVWLESKYTLRQLVT